MKIICNKCKEEIADIDEKYSFVNAEKDLGIYIYYRTSYLSGR